MGVWVRTTRLDIHVLNPLSSVVAMAISMLAQKLNMQPDEAERWIVNLIRNVRLDAKIDAQKVTLSTAWCGGHTSPVSPVQ